MQVEEAWREPGDGGEGDIQPCGCQVFTEEPVRLGIELKGRQSGGFPTFLIIEEGEGGMESEEVHGAKRSWAADLAVNSCGRERVRGEEEASRQGEERARAGETKQPEAGAKGEEGQRGSGRRQGRKAGARAKEQERKQAQEPEAGRQATGQQNEAT